MEEGNYQPRLTDNYMFLESVNDDFTAFPHTGEIPGDDLSLQARLSENTLIYVVLTATLMGSWRV